MGMNMNMGMGMTTTTTRPIIEVMNQHGHLTSWGRSHGKKGGFIRGKTYKWDFSGLLDSGGREDGDEVAAVLGTVEFRQPAGSLGAVDAMGWVGVGVAFVAGAVAAAPEDMGGDDGGSVGELWDLVEVGGVVLGWNGLDALVEGVFEKARSG
jgi:hypothetical protein